MRIHHENSTKKLYRRVNTTTRHHSYNPGAEYRLERNNKKGPDENLPQRESMHGKKQRGLDYSPLFHFLLGKIGQRWDEVYSEAKKRLDKDDPIFWMVARHEFQQKDYFSAGDSSFYPGLFIDEQGLLQQVDPSITADDIYVGCRCCTHTFIGVPVLWREE